MHGRVLARVCGLQYARAYWCVCCYMHVFTTSFDDFLHWPHIVCIFSISFKLCRNVRGVLLGCGDARIKACGVFCNGILQTLNGVGA